MNERNGKKIDQKILFNDEYAQDENGIEEKITYKYYKDYLSLTVETLGFRFRSNSWLLAINTAIITVMGVLLINKITPLFLVVLSILGVLISYTWSEMIESYRNVVRGRFEILREFESKFPVRMFQCDGDYIFGEKTASSVQPNATGRDTENKTKYSGVSTKEERIATYFMILYYSVIVISIMMVFIQIQYLGLESLLKIK